MLLGSHLAAAETAAIIGRAGDAARLPSFTQALSGGACCAHAERAHAVKGVGDSTSLQEASWLSMGMDKQWFAHAQFVPCRLLVNTSQGMHSRLQVAVRVPWPSLGGRAVEPAAGGARWPGRRWGPTGAAGAAAAGALSRPLRSGMSMLACAYTVLWVRLLYILPPQSQVRCSSCALLHLKALTCLEDPTRLRLWCHLRQGPLGKLTDHVIICGSEDAFVNFAEQVRPSCCACLSFTRVCMQMAGNAQAGAAEPSSEF